MNFTFDRSIVERVKSISSKFDQTYWREISRKQEFPLDYWNAIAENGLFGLVIPKEFGGMERNLVDLSLATQETAERYSGLGSYLFLSGCLVSTIFAKSSEEQKKKILPRLSKGELKISLALTEEKSGFDSSSIETSAVKVPEGFQISGQKRFVNNVDNADFLIVFARTTPAESSPKRSLGVSMFLVPTNSPEIKSKKLEKLGMDFVNNFDVEIKNLTVSEESLVGELNNAWYNAVESFNLDRVATSASLIGTGELALNDAADYARNRVVFNRPIGSNQGIQFPLADALAQLIAAENAMLKAASLQGQAQRFQSAANTALYASMSAASFATDRALQTFGGHGYYKMYDIERYWRDVRVHRFHPISEELLLSTIAEKTLGLPKSY